MLDVALGPARPDRDLLEGVMVWSTAPTGVGRRLSGDGLADPTDPRDESVPQYLSFDREPRTPASPRG
jgi:hypothetical protein